ncbi:MAG: peptidase M28, partial [Balneolaceae bacterium]
MYRFYLSLILITICIHPVLAQSIHEPTVDLDIVQQIIEEGTERSQIMDIASWLTDVYGPRLTNSPQMRRANEFTLQKLEE